MDETHKVSPLKVKIAKARPRKASGARWESIFGRSRAQEKSCRSHEVFRATWRLAGAIVDDVRDLFPEVANNFGEGRISHGDLVTLRNVLEFVERLPTNVAPIEFDILARGARKEAIVSLLRGALQYVGHLN